MTKRRSTAVAGAPISTATLDADTEPTLRDLFAAKALPMLIDIGHDEDWAVGQVADAAYQYADAMLAARGGA